MRRIFPDGTVNIVCSDCGETLLYHTPYRGFSTALCVKCQKKREEIDKELAKQAGKKQTKEGGL